MSNKLNPVARSTPPIYRDVNLQIVISITLMELLGTMSVNPALPGIVQAFNLSPQQIGWVTTAFVIPIAIGAPICGVLADRFGRKTLLVPSLFLFAIAGIACAFAPSFQLLLVGRFLQGVGAASLEALALALLGDLYTGKQLTAAMGLNASMIGLSLAVYPLLGGGLASMEWRYTFALPLLAFLVGIWLWRSLRLPQQEQSSDFDFKVYLRTIWGSIRRGRVIRLIFIVVALFVLLFGAYLTYIPTVAASLGASEIVIGILLASMALSFALISSQLGLFARSFSELTLIKISFLVYTLALVITPAIEHIWMLLIPSILFGIAHGIVFPTTQALLAELAPNTHRAGFMAVVAIAVPLGQAMGPLLGGLAFSAWEIRGVFYAGSLFAISTFILLNYLIPHRKSVNRS
ncbi:arabinose efflux permease family protein [Leptolyngbya sp. Heron Island J]|uniref:MFS transporter n=1 Tax=Leptolyngbya sp. Heron Island J TaxID=1385935 RepID=UPI0003B970DA|nr:MFS transporter [Leptolyngbya sp. Heron Island J]ESA37911.1 arabinose efflux permease family protein [Leptolyngbya sp. Heron Island J]